MAAIARAAPSARPGHPGVTALPGVAAFGAALACGGLIALSLPPFGWWPLGCLGLAGFALLLAGPGGPGLAVGRRTMVGAGVGLGQYGIGLWWVTECNADGYVGLLLHATAAVALAGALVPARRRWGVLVGLPAALVVAEWLRSHVPFGGLPIGGVALGQAGGPLAPSVRLGGGLALVAVTALVGTGLAQLVPLPRSAERARMPAGLVALAVVAAVVLAGRLGPDGAGPRPRPTVRVAAVQGGGQRGLRAVDTSPAVVTQRQLNASAGLPASVDLVVWPEDVVHTGGPVAATPEAASIAALARRLHTVVEAGVVEDIGPAHFRNAAVVWSPQGTIVARYDKVHRVPFGEYVPGRALVAKVADLSLIPADAVPGRGPGLLLTPAGPLGVVISYEVFYDELARSAVRAGGQILTVPTNAASYRSSQVPTQEVAASRLRALETGRDTVQASPTGFSAFVDHNGRVTARTALGRAQVLVGTVELRTGRTIFVRIGDRPVLVGALAWLLLAGLAGRRRARTARPRLNSR